MEDKYFQKALSNMTSEFAYAGAVRHLYDLGYSAERIKQEISYPVSLEKITRVMEEYEKKKNSPEDEYEFVLETNVYGRRSYRRVKKGER